MTKKETWITPLGQDASLEAARRRATDPKYAALEKKHAVALAIADLVILHRTRASLTQKQLAARMGTTEPVISRLESGFQVPSLETLRRFAEALGGKVKIDIVDIAPHKESRESARHFARKSGSRAAR